MMKVLLLLGMIIVDDVMAARSSSPPWVGSGSRSGRSAATDGKCLRKGGVPCVQAGDA